MKKVYDYTNKCGSCKYFCFNTKNGEVVRYGVCERKISKTVNTYFFIPYHHMQAADKACKKYEKGDIE